MADSIIIESRAKDFIKQEGGEDFRVAGDTLAVVQDKVQVILREAVKRAKENGRKTVQPQDI